MMKTTSKRWHLKALILCAIGLLAPTHSVQAAYPERPIRLVVPAGAGGITDQLARIVAERASKVLGQQIVVENKAGASGVIGSTLVANAQPDGYTLLMVFPSHVANPSTKKSLPYDTVKDFEPIVKVGLVTEILLVNKDGPLDSIEALIKAASVKKEALAFGSVGVGSLADFCTRMFQDQAGIEMLSVTYKSEPDVLLALIRNDIQVAFISTPSALPMIQEGRVRALGFSSSKRTPVLPDLPTISEAGLPGYDTTGWNGIFAPAGTPADIVATLNKAINEVLADPTVADRFQKLGVTPFGGPPEVLQQSVIKDIADVKSALDRAGFKPQ